MRQMSHDGIRPALPTEAPFLSELALRSKEHWGYGAEFLEACRAELTVSPEDIAARRVLVLEQMNRVVGFYTLSVRGDEAELVHLFVDPQVIRRGCGRRLWQHAVQSAARLALKQLMIQSDPFAEKFYRSMGARRIGEVVSSILPDRRLPLMRFSLLPPQK